MWRFFTGTILSVLYVESRILQLDYATAPPIDDSDTMFEPKAYGVPYSINFKAFDDRDNDDNPYDVMKRTGDNDKKPCAIVVLSNVQNPIMHSLLRRYRYDSNVVLAIVVLGLMVTGTVHAIEGGRKVLFKLGVLIPNSVKYFVKLPQGVQSSTVLVPLHDKAFSPLGGFIRYYKEVPPIPQSW